MIRSARPSPLMSPAELTDCRCSVIFGFAMDDKAAAAGSNIGEFDGRGVVCCAKDDIGAAGEFDPLGSAYGTNDQISEAIAVDITSAADGAAAVVGSGFTVDDKAAAAGGASESSMAVVLSVVPKTT